MKEGVVVIPKDLVDSGIASWKAARETNKIKDTTRPEVYRAIGRFVTELVVPGIYVEEGEVLIHSEDWYINGSEKQRKFYEIIDGLSASETSKMISVGKTIARRLAKEILKGEIK